MSTIDNNEEKHKQEMLDEIESIEEKNERTFQTFKFEDIKSAISGAFYDTQDKSSILISEIKSNEELSDSEKEEKVNEILNANALQQIISGSIFNIFENLSAETLYKIRDALSSLNESQHSLRSKTISLLLQLQGTYKNVPEFGEYVVRMEREGATKEKHKHQDYFAFIPKSHKKLNKEQIIFITTLFLYNTSQYKYTSPNKKEDPAEYLKETEYDAVFIDFVKSLHGKNITELLKYFHLN